MQITPVNNGFSLVEIIQPNPDQTAVKRINQVEIQKDFKTFEKFISQNQKNAVVTENSDNNSNVMEYGFRIQTNTPLSGLEKTGKSFNETKRLKNLKYYKDLENQPADDNIAFNSENANEASKGSGYYIVINSPSGYPKLNLTKRFTSEIQKRINNTYHLGFRKEPGTLVNLVL